MQTPPRAGCHPYFVAGMAGGGRLSQGWGSWRTHEPWAPQRHRAGWPPEVAFGGGPRGAPGAPVLPVFARKTLWSGPPVLLVLSSRGCTGAGESQSSCSLCRVTSSDRGASCPPHLRNGHDQIRWATCMCATPRRPGGEGGVFLGCLDFGQDEAAGGGRLARRLSSFPAS